MKKFDLKKFSEAVKKKRKQEEVSREKLAAKIGTSAKVIQDIEAMQGSPNAGNFMNICLWLDQEPITFMTSEKVLAKRAEKEKAKQDQPE